MNIRDFFPLGKALGKAFCNRTSETEWLVNNIAASKHSLLIAPRRYGKSSLAEKALAQSKLPTVRMSFNVCTDEEDIELLLHYGVSSLIGKAIGSLERAVNILKNYVKNLTPIISVAHGSAVIELQPNKQKTPALNIEEALGLVDRLLAENNQKAVMLLDEFQMVGDIAKGAGVEAAIRNAAQDMQNLALIFSGSNRRILQSMFENDTRPLYKLCRKLSLQRISADHYIKHMNKAAQQFWGSNLDEDVSSLILQLSERHPYYVNYLCDAVWTICSSLPKSSDVIKAWDQVIEEELSDANTEIIALPIGQRKVLKYIANSNGETLMSIEAVKQIGSAPSSISSSVTALLEKDVIEPHNHGYRTINPIVAKILRRV